VAEMDELVKKIMAQMQQQNDAPTAQSTTTASAPTAPTKELDASDYPLFSKHPDLIKSPSGKGLDEITLDNVMKDNVKADDLRITKETLQYQGEIAKNAGRPAIQKNFARAAELTAIPDEKILAMYGALRPYRSSKQDLEDIAKELETKYNAPICAAWFREAATNYEGRKKLKGDN
jgi:propanediol dehydratase small subunit